MGRRTLSERLWAKVDKTDTCWLWTGCKHGNGYGQICRDYKMVDAHRFAYELEVGPIPEGYHIDHLCRNPGCVNPGHLEAVTPRENTLRSPVARAAINARRAECLNGHPFNEANTYVRKDGARQCRVCVRERTAKQREVAA